MNRISRRTFLGATGALAMTSATRTAVAAQEAAGDPMRAGVIGCRNRGHQVATSFLRSKQFEIAAVCDCDSAMADRGLAEIKKHGFDIRPRIEKDFRKVLEDKNVDAVIVATPDHWHALITALALEAGKHVYVEKPASYNIADGQAMVAAQARHPDLIVQVGTQQRSGKHFIEARDFVKSGALGTIGFVRAWIAHRRHTIPIVPDSAPPASLDYDLWVGPAPYRPYNEQRVHYNWHFVKEYGTGEMANWGAHWVDIVRWFLDLDYPESVAGYGGQFVVHDAKEWPDTQTVLYEYPGLTFLWEQRLWTKFTIHDKACGVEIGGESGTLVIDRAGWSFHPSDGEPENRPGSEIDVAHAVNFAQSIRGEAKPAASIEEGHKTAALCHLGNIAVELNRRIEFDGATQTFEDEAEANKLLGRDYRAPWRLPA